MPRAEVDPKTLVCQARAGDVRSRARLFSVVEDGGPAGQVVVQELAPQAGRACVVGITGPPGAGKSTLLAKLAAEIRRTGQTVAILAVDPASPLTGGAVLGDRIRMQDLHGDSGVFVRSLSTRGAIGGIAHAAADMVLVADALGYDVVLIETVGAGQDEAAIAGIAPTVVLVQVPHLGDDVQAIKAGILELADILVVNKADRDGADEAAAFLRAMLSLSTRNGSWRPPVVKTSARTGEGVGQLLQAIRDHHAYLRQPGRLETWRSERTRSLILNRLRERLLARVLADTSPLELRALLDEVASRKVSIDQAVERLLQGRKDSDPTQP